MLALLLGAAAGVLGRASHADGAGKLLDAVLGIVLVCKSAAAAEPGNGADAPHCPDCLLSPGPVLAGALLALLLATSSLMAIARLRPAPVRIPARRAGAGPLGSRAPPFRR